MILFEDRLARTVSAIVGLALLPGCPAGEGAKDLGGDSAAVTTDTSTVAPIPTLEGMCEGGEAPEPEYLPGLEYFVREGFMTIEPGTDCPDLEGAELRTHNCVFDIWTEVTCAFNRVDRDQRYESDHYGSWFVSTTADDPDRVDVCYYEGVFKEGSTTCGRPLLREGEAVVAPVARRDDWSAQAAPVVAGLSPSEREAAASYWLDCATLEHASVASFAHFSLDLMRLGAPPSLLRDAHQAGLDEIDHAQRCFALASAYAGEPLGPGPLEMHPPSAKGRIEVAEALFREGCVGETLAAVDAAARLAGAKDRAVREALTVILKDESSHAALAWRALRWMLDADADGAVRARLEEVFAEEEARWTALEPTAEVSAALIGHGLLDDRSRAREFRRAWDEVIAPSWASLA